jgi:hypothetical protein
MWPFSRKVPLQTQLDELAAAGITVNPGVTVADLLMFGTKAQLEAKPYDALIVTLASELEREPYSPIADRLWMCDYERIEGPGDYRRVLQRLELMTGRALAIADLNDQVDIEAGEAWVQFKVGDGFVRWDFQVNDDWLDPEVLLKYDELLERSGASVRVYSNHRDYGQSALLGAFRPDDKARFDALTKIRLTPIASQR